MTMQHDWFLPVDIQMKWEDFQKLPRHPAYRYEYRNGQLRLSGRPALRNCSISTVRSASPGAEGLEDRFSLLPLTDFASQDLSELFQSAFQRSAPYAALSPGELQQATQDHFLNALEERPWPVIREAGRGVVITGTRHPVGICLVTLVPQADWSDFTDPRWHQVPPPHALDQKWGQPHLTWLFISPRYQRQGLGRMLLNHACDALHRLGYPHLFSTVLTGDHASQLWHWKQGFKLLPREEILNPGTSPDRLDTH